MLCKNTMEAVLALAMIKYSAENDGRNGISRKDVTELVELHGGSKEDVSRMMILALNQFAIKAMSFA